MKEEMEKGVGVAKEERKKMIIVMVQESITCFPGN